MQSLHRTGVITTDSLAKKSACDLFCGSHNFVLVEGEGPVNKLLQFDELLLFSF